MTSPNWPTNLRRRSIPNVEGLRSKSTTACSWPIPDSDQVHTSFINMAAPLMGRNVTVG